MSTSLARSALGVPTLLLLLASAAPAQIVETREGEANPMVSVFKSTLYGGAAGGVLGLAVGLAQDDGDLGDPVKWGFVGGTFFGFGYGLYHVSTRPEPRGMLDRRGGTWALRPPSVEAVSRAPATAALARVDPSALRAAAGVRVPLAALHF